MGVNETPQRQGYEQRDISIRAVAVFAVSLIVALIIVHFLALGEFHRLAQQSSPYSALSPLEPTREEFTGPRLLVNQKLDMETFHATEDTLLNNYGWIDRNRGVVRIPIDRAIELLAQRGVQP